MSRWTRLAIAGTVGIVATSLLFTPSATAARPKADNSVVVLRVTTTDPNAAAARLAAGGFDLVESRIGNDLLVMGDATTAGKLAALGYPVTVHQQLPAVSLELDQGAAAQAASFYGGYLTADEYVAHLDAVAAAYPTLAVSYDVGDSWLKTQGLGGNDLKAICITALQPGDCALAPTSAKPRFFLLGTVHARELTPTELANRWIDELTTKYGVDAEITSLVNSTELWVLPLANPDGREIAETGVSSPYLQRKNGDNIGGGGCANPPTVSNQSGVDLNRNFNFQWGGVGTSSNPCDQTYKGVSAASEPETAAIQSLLSTLFADQRGPLNTDVAPLTTTGYLLSLHSYANMVLFPWGSTNSASPNDAGLRSTSFRLSYYNGYQTGQPGQILYNTTGTTDDWLYGDRGIAAGTMEVGPNSGSCSGFIPAYSCQASFWSVNRPVLIEAAKLARAPYQLSLGPNSRNPAASPASVVAGASVTVSATGDDAALGNSGVGKPASQTVTAGRYYLDVAPWAGGTPVSMTATDGNFNSKTEGIRATVTTTGWTVGKHTVYVQARDQQNNWGPVSAAFITIN